MEKEQSRAVALGKPGDSPAFETFLAAQFYLPLFGLLFCFLLTSSAEGQLWCLLATFLGGTEMTFRFEELNFSALSHQWPAARRFLLVVSTSRRSPVRRFRLQAVVSLSFRLQAIDLLKAERQAAGSPNYLREKRSPGTHAEDLASQSTVRAAGCTHPL